ncbi:MAG: glycosyltransferase family 2 protein [bacterium JZ-2024 1]
MANSANDPEVAVVIPMWRADGSFASTLHSLLTQSLKPVQIILVDNGQNAPALRIARDLLPDLVLIQNPSNLGFATAANQGIIAADAPFVCLLNQDCRLSADYLIRVASALLKYPDCFAASGLLVQDDGTIDSAGHAVYRDRVAADIHVPPSDTSRPCEVWGLSATATVYRRAALFDLAPTLHPFDTAFFSYLEDFDLNYRARSLGLRSLLIPSAIAYHQRSSSGGRKSFAIRWRAHKNYFLMLAKYESPSRIASDFPDLFPQLVWHLFQSVFPNPLFLFADLQIFLLFRHILRWRRWFRMRAKYDPMLHPLVRSGRWLREPLTAHPGFPL